MIEEKKRNKSCVNKLKRLGIPATHCVRDSKVRATPLIVNLFTNLYNVHYYESRSGTQGISTNDSKVHPIY